MSLGKLFTLSDTNITSKVRKNGSTGLYYKGVLFSKIAKPETPNNPEVRTIDDLFDGGKDVQSK